MDETTETLYLNLFVNNNNQTNSAPIPCAINQPFNTILTDLSEWNIYINSITLSSGELAYCNVYKNMVWNAANFATNKLNWSITLYDSTGYNFNLATNTNLLISGIDEDPATPGLYRGVAVFLQYVSENADFGQYPNPNVQGTGANSKNYPLSYFNIHSIQQVLDFANTAIASGLALYTPAITKAMYFYFNPASSLYSFYVDKTIQASGLNFFCNAFFEKLIDGFRFRFLKDTDIINEVPYRGMSFEFIKTTLPYNQDASGNTTYVAEFGTIQNLLDIHSLVVTCDGSLSVVQKQIFQATSANGTPGMNPQTSSILKSLDFVFSSQSASINNSTIQFEAGTLDRPINILSAIELNNIQLNFKILNINGDFIPVSISSNGIVNIKFCLKKKAQKNRLSVRL